MTVIYEHYYMSSRFFMALFCVLSGIFLWCQVVEHKNNKVASVIYAACCLWAMLTAVCLLVQPFIRVVAVVEVHDYEDAEFATYSILERKGEHRYEVEKLVHLWYKVPNEDIGTFEIVKYP